MQLYELSLTEVAEKIRTREVSPVEVTQSSLDRLAEVEPAITAFVTITGDQALARAAEAERGDRSRPVPRCPTRHSARRQRSVRHRRDPDDVQFPAACRERADSRQCVGSQAERRRNDRGRQDPDTRIRLWSNDSDRRESVGRHPHTRWLQRRFRCSGRRGSRARRVGSDTGGSIRIPAGVCGVVGLKPTFGRASRAGVASLSWSLDHVGPLTRNVSDAGLVLGAMSGYDRRDPASVDMPVPDFLAGITDGVAGTRIGIPSNFYTHNVQPEVTEVAHRAAEALERLGAILVEVEVPLEEYVLPVEWAILTAEASAYHMDSTRQSPELFTDEVRTLVEAGEAILATDYINAVRLRTRIQEAWRDMYSTIDVLLAPTVPGVASLRSDPFFHWEDGTVEGSTSAYSRMSAPANVTGLPALQVPAEFSAGGLPIGVQIIGKPFCEAEILRVGYALEQSSDVVGRIAPVVTAGTAAL